MSMTVQRKRDIYVRLRNAEVERETAPTTIKDQLAGRSLSIRFCLISIFRILSGHLAWIGGILGGVAGWGMVLYSVKSLPIQTGGLPYLFWPHVLLIILQFSLGSALLFTLLGFGGELVLRTVFSSRGSAFIHLLR